jgi:hypothetical protein
MTRDTNRSSSNYDRAGAECTVHTKKSSRRIGSSSTSYELGVTERTTQEDNTHTCAAK